MYNRIRIVSFFIPIRKLYTKKNAWKNAQNNNPACGYAKHLLSSGKPPPKATGKTSGDYWNKIRFYCREAKISPDGLLIVRNLPDVKSGNIPRNRIIVPKPLVQSLLWHLHNHDNEHPTKTQLKGVFQMGFHAMELDRHLNQVYSSCYKCQVLQRLPKQLMTKSLYHPTVIYMH